MCVFLVKYSRPWERICATHLVPIDLDECYHHISYPCFVNHSFPDQQIERLYDIRLSLRRKSRKWHPSGLFSRDKKTIMSHTTFWSSPPLNDIVLYLNLISLQFVHGGLYAGLVPNIQKATVGTMYSGPRKNASQTYRYPALESKGGLGRHSLNVRRVMSISVAWLALTH